jgi:glycosyltransferase involved in cell wall biosynthesis
MIPNFVDTEVFHPGRSDALRRELAISEETLVVLSVAAIKRGHKRVDHLISEFVSVVEANPEFPVVLVVAGGQESETSQVIAEGTAKLGHRVRFLVRFPRSRMAELYRMADLFVLASLKEMMPIAVLEALASGLPCLTHRHPIMQWMVGQGGSAIDMEAPGELFAAIIGLLRHAEGRRQVGAMARARALDSFGTDRIVTQILDYYSVVLGDRAASAMP